MESNVAFENVITLIQHEHPLHLVDLQPCYPDYREFSDDEEEDRVIKWDFQSPCSQCGKDINVYHRYYYKCTDSSCDYVLHKSCGKPLPETLILKSHRLTHTYTLHQGLVPYYYDPCHICSDQVSDNWYYQCSLCEWYSSFRVVHVKCAMKERAENHIIYHPSHPHPLDTVTSRTIMCECDACGKKHEGIFYHCTTCFYHTINTDCAFLPRKLQFQHHTHPLIISYSSEHIERSYYTGFNCRICRAPFGLDHLWIYKCESCRYFVHLDCAMSIFLSAAGIGKTIKNYKDADHPGLLKLPFPDQTYSILKHCLSKESGSTTGETSQRNLNNHICHQHVLNLVSTQPNDSKGATSSSGSISCHDPMKRIELLCNGCVRPIMDVPFHDVIGIAWGSHVLQKARIMELDKHPLKLTYGPVENHKSEYICEVCEEELNPNFWFYHCQECAYSIHTRCAPLIVNFEAAVHNYRSLYKYLNMKFGGSYNIKGHEHSVSLAVGSDADGKCTICDRNMSKVIIVKCLKCKLHAMHYQCCKRL